MRSPYAAMHLRFASLFRRATRLVATHITVYGQTTVAGEARFPHVGGGLTSTSTSSSSSSPPPSLHPPSPAGSHTVCHAAHESSPWSDAAASFCSHSRCDFSTQRSRREPVVGARFDAAKLRQEWRPPPPLPVGAILACDAGSRSSLWTQGHSDDGAAQRFKLVPQSGGNGRGLAQ